MFHRFCVVLLASSFVLGQTAGTEPAAVQRLQAMAQQLQLTEPQKEQIMPILVEEAPKVKAVKADTTLPQNEKLAKLMQIRNETNGKIRPILTPPQQQKLDQMRAQQRQQMLQELTAAKNAK
jgi:Spy/CpxP family protein refolding chaperone